MSVSPIRPALKREQLKLELVLPQDLANVWSVVGKDLLVVARRSRASWTPEHVFASIYNRMAELFVGYYGTSYAGFFVVNQLLDPFTGGRALCVWITFSRTPGAVDEGLPQIDSIARSLGCTSVKLQSPRRGWIRRLAPFGYQVRDYVLEKPLEVNNG